MSIADLTPDQLAELRRVGVAAFDELIRLCPVPADAGGGWLAEPASVPEGLRGGLDLHGEGATQAEAQADLLRQLERVGLWAGEVVGQALGSAPEPSACPGTPTGCHAALKWCDDCGDVGAVCDADGCYSHTCIECKAHPVELHDALRCQSCLDTQAALACELR